MFANRRTEWKCVGGQGVSNHADIPVAIDIGIQQQPAFTEVPIARCEAAGRFAKERHSRTAFQVACLHLTTPKAGFHAYVRGRLGAALQFLPLLQGDIFATPIFFKTFGAAEINTGPFANNEGRASELGNLAFNIFLHHAHGGHHHDDGEDTDDHADEREGGAQLVGANSAECHGEAFARLARPGLHPMG